MPYESIQKYGNIDGVQAKNPKVSFDYGDWEFIAYAATSEQIEQIRELIAVAKPAKGSDITVQQIIMEEAETYFQGQKSVNEVADIIQNRVQLYISENN